MSSRRRSPRLKIKASKQDSESPEPQFVPIVNRRRSLAKVPIVNTSVPKFVDDVEIIPQLVDDCEPLSTAARAKVDKFYVRVDVGRKGTSMLTPVSMLSWTVNDVVHGLTEVLAQYGLTPNHCTFGCTWDGKEHMELIAYPLKFLNPQLPWLQEGFKIIIMKKAGKPAKVLILHCISQCILFCVNM